MTEPALPSFRYFDAYLRQLPPRVPESLLSERPWPGASMMHGLAGLGFFFLEHHRLTGDAASLARARTLVDDAFHYAQERPADAFGHRFGGAPDADIEELSEGVFTGWAGLGWTAIIVGERSGDRALVRRGEATIEASFDRHRRRVHRSCELFKGTAGYVALANDLARRGFATTIADEATRLAFAPLASPLEEGAPLGAAHGRTGLLLALSMRPAATAAEDALLREALEAFSAIATRDEDDALIAWPQAVGQEAPGARWATFCNGAVGQALLFDQAARRFDDPAHAQTAALIAETVHEVTTAHPTLCCGLAGQAVALDGHARRTTSELHAERAQARCLAALRIPSRVDGLSLFQGRLGLAYVALLQANGEPLRFPLL